MRVAESTDTASATIGCPTPPPWRTMKAYLVTFIVLSSYLWIKLMSRFRTAATTHQKLERANVRNARRIYRTILELQGLYIKVGQLISIMTNFLPDVYQKELEGLQDKVPAHSFKAIRQRFLEEFDGREPSELFEEFDEQAIASASIGQVHLARLPGGHRVAVKVQYPNIVKIVRSDLLTLRRIFAITERFVPYQGLSGVYEEISVIILEELNFESEADNVDQIAANFEGQPEVNFPKVVREFSTRRVLTTEYIRGVKISDLAALEKMQVDRRSVARLVIEAYCQQIFHHGIYHADPHPGNILVSDSGAITFIDFGAVASISADMRQGILAFLQGAINRDTAKLVDAMRDMGFIAHHADPKIYERVIDYFHGRFQKEVKLESFSLQDIKFDPQRGLENLADLRKMDISLRDITSAFYVPKEWIMLERTILLLMGLCTNLDPTLNPMEVIRPHVEEFVLGKDGDWSKFMLDTARDITLATLAVPPEIKRFTSHAVGGDLEIQIAGARERSRLVYGLAHQFLFAALGITAFSFSLFYEARGEHEVQFWLQVTAGSLGVLLVHSFWSTRRWLKKHF